ncbi:MULTISPECIES: hypothetical protein [Mucilaginibacter]|uniref:hypothetical protein n=1 Tax=Mucilaginibacter TaxID=423349 RepID=UPI000DCBD487|nr:MULTISPECIES: hypothetical protein [Mucilaginibacter]QTE36782.1 hypothetical protein J3L18_27290 [Mucilaginibacter gossypii]RAV45771.1 hypothetical protein DIU36_30745 [Mucilaginibacter rubeus]GGB30262.1 hypothetical protein GCM10011500_53330 [Mucilaginibacter rubeus]
MIKFSIKIDDEAHSLNEEDGIGLDKIGDFLKNLYCAIDNGTEHKVTLGNVRGNCYALDFYTRDNALYENFLTVHKNIEQLDVDSLPIEQKRYAASLKAILGGKYFLTAYDKNDQEVAAINEIGKKQIASFYYSTDTVYGILSELGSSTLTSAKKHIYIDGIGYKIFISRDQDLELKPFYGTHKLRIELRQKRSSTDGHIVNSELLSFTAVSKGNLIDNLNDSDAIELKILKNTHTIEDILNSIYASR